jgi:hypothetical protein
VLWGDDNDDTRAAECKMGKLDGDGMPMMKEGRRGASGWMNVSSESDCNDETTCIHCISDRSCVTERIPGD